MFRKVNTVVMYDEGEGHYHRIVRLGEHDYRGNVGL